MKNKNQAMASLWSVAIVLSVVVCIFAVLFAAFTGRDTDSAKKSIPAETEVVISAEPSPVETEAVISAEPAAAPEEADTETAITGNAEN